MSRKSPLEELDLAIKDAKSKLEVGDGGKKNRSVSAGRVLSDIIAGVLVGGFVGYNLDKWFDSLPLFSFVFLVIGMVAAFLNIYRAGTESD